jgi:hypothetical protein
MTRGGFTPKKRLAIAAQRFYFSDPCKKGAITASRRAFGTFSLIPAITYDQKKNANPERLTEVLAVVAAEAYRK